MVVALTIPVSELIFFLGISLVLGYGSSMLLKHYGIPNVLIYIIVGFLVGNLLVPEVQSTESFKYWFKFVETLALGLIGYQIGTEMKLKLLKKNSRVITFLTLFQVIITFLVVFIAAYYFIGDILLALIFGGLATATAPAATMEIIRKFKAKGPLTSHLQWVLAFDDMLAVLIVEGILAYATISLLGSGVTIIGFVGEIAREILLAVFLGAVVGYLVDVIIEKIDDRMEMMEITLGALIFLMGAALFLHTSVILAAMTVGALTVNREGDNYKRASELLEILMSPILIVFFVLVGSELRFNSFTPLPWFALIYFIVRAAGKIYGTRIGAELSKANTTVKQNLGMGMVPQGGVALGLMAVAADLMIEAGLPDFAQLLISTIVISTVFSEGIGSFLSMYGLKRAGELNKFTGLDHGDGINGSHQDESHDTLQGTSISSDIENEVQLN